MRIKNSIRNTVSSIASIVILTVLGFVSTKYFIKYLGVEYNGINGTFTNILSILAITELGLGGAITYNLYKPIAEKNYKKISSIMTFYKNCYRVIGIIIYTLSLITSIFIQIFLKDTTFSVNYIRFLFILFAINTSISYFFSFNRNLFYAYEQNYIVTVIDFIVRTIKIILQIISLILWKNYILFLLINIFFTFLANFIIHLYAKKIYKNISYKSECKDVETEKEVFKYVKSYAVIQLLVASINFTDSLIVSSFINVIVAGLYFNYNLIFSQVNRIINSFFNSIGASIGNLVVENNKNKIKIIFLNMEYLCFFMAMFCVACFTFLTEPFIKLWIGPEYLLPFSTLLVLVFNFYSNIHRQPINYFLSGNGMFKEMIKPLFIESILNLVISIVLAIKIGLIGVFIGTAISAIAGWIYTSILINRKNEMPVGKYFIRQIIFLSATILELIVLKLIFMIYLPSSLLIQIIYIFIICCILSGFTILVVLFKNEKVEYLKDLFIKMLKKLKVLK